MMQKSNGMSERIRPHALIRIIEDSEIPLGEEESRLQKIKGKVEHDEQLSREMKPSSPDWLKGPTSGRRG